MHSSSSNASGTSGWDGREGPELMLLPVEVRAGTCGLRPGERCPVVQQESRRSRGNKSRGNLCRWRTKPVCQLPPMVTEIPGDLFLLLRCPQTAAIQRRADLELGCGERDCGEPAAPTCPLGTEAPLCQLQTGGRPPELSPQ